MGSRCWTRWWSTPWSWSAANVPDTDDSHAHRLPCALLLVALAAPAAHAQSLEDRLNQLFIFGEGEEALHLGGSAASENPGISVHGDHFIPSAVEGNATIISFITGSVSSNVANIPVSSSSGGETFRFEGATPVRTSISAGPIYAERAQTLGRGRLFVSLARTGLHYETLRGVPLDALPLVFTHQNVDFPNCDAIFGGDCSVYGIPTFENEVIDFTLNLDMTVDVTFRSTLTTTSRPSAASTARKTRDIPPPPSSRSIR